MLLLSACGDKDKIVVFLPRFGILVVVIDGDAVTQHFDYHFIANYSPIMFICFMNFITTLPSSKSFKQHLAYYSDFI